MVTPPFRGTPLSYRCLDCTIGVGDRNGAPIVRQMEAHLEHHPDHRLVLSSERTGHHLNDISSDIRNLIRLGAVPFPNDAGKGHGGDLIHREDFDQVTKTQSESFVIEIPVGDQDG